jgi:hypothetical protein
MGIYQMLSAEYNADVLPWFWEITTDHLFDDDPEWHTKNNIRSGKGTTGPHNGDETLKDKVSGYTFRMYDDDGELYYTGKLYVTPETLDDPEYNESALSAALNNYGTPNAGAVTIRYHGHPEWEIG